MEAKGQKAPDFYVVGSKVTDEIKALEQPGNGVIIKGFVSEEELAELYDTTRIVVVPAAVWRRRQRKGSRGTLQRSSHCDHFRRLRGDSGGGNRDGDRRFPRAVCPDSGRSLRRSVPRRQMSDKTQEYVRRHYSVDAAWEVIREDFE